jgi:hypothetical protein
MQTRQNKQFINGKEEVYKNYVFSYLLQKLLHILQKILLVMYKVPFHLVPLSILYLLYQ